jgi:hypothetical protein
MALVVELFLSVHEMKALVCEVALHLFETPEERRGDCETRIHGDSQRLRVPASPSLRVSYPSSFMLLPFVRVLNNSSSLS